MAWLMTMRTAETTDVTGVLPLDEIRSVLDDHPIRLAILFGSCADGTTHSGSDIDIAVELDGFQPGDTDYNEAFFGLSADLSETLRTDDVDLVDVHTLSPSLARAVFDDGVLLVGDSERVDTLRRELIPEDDDEHSPRERFDEALERIDHHLA